MNLPGRRVGQYARLTSKKGIQMKRTVLLMGVLSALAAGVGCKREGLQPMPETLPSEGVILHTWELPVGGGFVLQHQEVLVSEVWNDVFPLNASIAEPAAQLVSRLYLIADMRKQFISWVSMPEAGPFRCRELSPDGRRIIFDMPLVAKQEDNYPRVQTRGIRPRVVGIYSKQVGKVLTVDDFSEVYSLSRSTLWRKGNDLAAFTTFCRLPDCESWGLTVVSYSGRIVLDIRVHRQLQGLEFIAWSPDGRRLAALRPVKPQADGEGGGDLVEIDLATGAVREIDTVSSELSVEHLGRFERIIQWSADGTLQPIQVRSAAGSI